MKIKQRGFTLIELLVVIAIIGLLSTMAVVSLNSARGKARDARRVSDVKQLSTILEMEAATSETTALGTCTTAGTIASTCTGAGEVGDQFVNFNDPSAGAAVACVNATPGLCNYTIGIAGATVGNYEICFYLEQGAGSLTKGMKKIVEGSIISDVCSN